MQVIIWAASTFKFILITKREKDFLVLEVSELTVQTEDAEENDDCVYL